MIARTTMLSVSGALLVGLVSGGCERQEPTASAESQSTLARSTGAQRSAAMSFEALDRDKDGSITLWEAQANAWPAARFSELDKNGDGKLDRTEYPESAAGA